MVNKKKAIRKPTIQRDLEQRVVNLETVNEIKTERVNDLVGLSYRLAKDVEKKLDELFHSKIETVLSILLALVVVTGLL